MTYQVLARKWRPVTFDQVLGQNHVIRSLKNSVSSNRLAQSYLLSGTRGVGKTTIARIMAKALRCEKLTIESNPCNSCSACLDVDTGSSLDVVEVDGASNNSVENIREIISNLYYSPTFGEKRIVIIDEVHMLSISAFNALLKTLEEPPSHAIFIFATTEPQKIPKTVLSRVQQFDLRDIKLAEMKQQLEIIAKAEGFSFKGNVQDTLCGIANGSMRDLLSLVEQLLLLCEDRIITEETVRDSLGIIESAKVKLLVNYVYQEQLNELVEELESLFQSSINLEHLVFSICEELFLRLKKALKNSSSEEHFLFESFSKDSAYILDSISPELSFKALMIKLAKRSDYFKESGVKLKNSNVASGLPVQRSEHQSEKSEQSVENKRSKEEEIHEGEEIKVTDEVEVKEEVSLPPVEQAAATKDNEEESKIKLENENDSHASKEEKVVEEKKVQSWEAFSEWLIEKAPALSSTIEQGNFTTNESTFLERGLVTLKFEEDSSVFYEHIQETNGEEKLKIFLAEYFEVEGEKVNLNIELIKEAEVESFKSMANIKEDEYQKTLLERENGLRESDLIKLAEKMFDTELDKVIANKEI
jgi:DNA polymerase III subunit gamma/tau